MKIEKLEMDNDLEERLLSIRNMVDLALLAFHEDKHELLPTALEEVFYKAQEILDNYCVVSV
jgi:hypothetical protein